MHARHSFVRWFLALGALPLAAQQASLRGGALERRAKAGEEAPIAAVRTLDEARPGMAAAQRAGWDRFLAAHGRWDALLDARTGMPALVSGEGIPAIPGRGNSLRAQAAPDLAGMERWTRDFIAASPELFPGLDPAQLSVNAGRSGQFGDEGQLWFIDFDQRLNGVVVEGAQLVFRFNHGNLVQFGADRWGRARVDAEAPAFDAAEAGRRAADLFGWNDTTDAVVSGPALLYLAGANLDAPDGTDRDELGRGYRGAFGRGGYTHRLAYETVLRREGTPGTWRVRLSAVDGALLEMSDLNDYGMVKGGVYPGTATGRGSETTLPLAFANYGSSAYADAGGNFTGSTGTTTLAGKYVKIADQCGAISRAADSTGLISMGSSNGTDCTTPGYGGAGDTHASRTGYYHVDAIKQKARGYLPGNSWVNGQLTVNMNLNNVCNAYWNGSTLNFFRSGSGCANTGELPDVFLHEFGHGLDSNDGATVGDRGTGEAYGDITAFTAGHHSCIGPGFLSKNCSGYGDSCKSCTGVRDVDYKAHASGAPWTPATVTAKCPASQCRGVMGKECHCESMPITQAMWDMAQALVTKYGANTGWVATDRIWFGAVPSVRSAYQKVTGGANGCGASNFYPVFLAVNDNDGNLSNGTPDAAQIWAAFNAHGIACATQNHTSTRTGATLATPTVAKPTVSGTSAALSWGAISGATSYAVYKNTAGCGASFARIGTPTGTTFTDPAAGAGTTYYAVQAISASGISQLSACATVTR